MQSIFDISNKEEDLYAILNCVDTSSPEQIKTEYKRLALIHHPDKQNPTKVTKDFEKIKAAYEVLGNPEKRALYERWRSSRLMIPFSEFAKLGTHAQTVHWQALPTQMTITKENETDFSRDLKSIRVPATANYLPKIHIESNSGSFWKKKKEYSIQKQ